MQGAGRPWRAVADLPEWVRETWVQELPLWWLCLKLSLNSLNCKMGTIIVAVICTALKMK